MCKSKLQYKILQNSKKFNGHNTDKVLKEGITVNKLCAIYLCLNIFYIIK